ncbi:hypothetical protein [Vreelandella sp. EE7]
MKRYTTIMATSHPDKHGDRLARSALDQLADSVCNSFIPMNVEHDPRGGPCGRVLSAEVRERADGEYEVAADVEIFEGTIAKIQDGREVVQNRTQPSGTLAVTWDRSYLNEEDQELIAELAEAIGAHTNQEHKKAAEPLSILWLIAGFLGVAGSSFAAGFFGKMGSDSWDLAKKKLSKLIERKAASKDEFLLIFSTHVGHPHHDHVVEVDVCITNPSESLIDSFWKVGVPQLESVLPQYVETSTELRKLFFEFDSDGIRLKYGVRFDCAPLKFSQSTQEILKANTDSIERGHSADARTSRG